MHLDPAAPRVPGQLAASPMKLRAEGHGYGYAETQDGATGGSKGRMQQPSPARSRRSLVDDRASHNQDRAGTAADAGGILGSRGPGFGRAGAPASAGGSRPAFGSSAVRSSSAPRGAVASSSGGGFSAGSPGPHRASTPTRAAYGGGSEQLLSPAVQQAASRSLAYYGLRAPSAAPPALQLRSGTSWDTSPFILSARSGSDARPKHPAGVARVPSASADGRASHASPLHGSPYMQSVAAYRSGGSGGSGGSGASASPSGAYARTPSRPGSRGQSAEGAPLVHTPSDAAGRPLSATGSARGRSSSGSRSGGDAQRGGNLDSSAWSEFLQVGGTPHAAGMSSAQAATAQMLQDLGIVPPSPPPPTQPQRGASGSRGPTPQRQRSGTSPQQLGRQPSGGVSRPFRQPSAGSYTPGRQGSSSGGGANSTARGAGSILTSGGTARTLSGPGSPSASSAAAAQAASIIARRLSEAAAADASAQAALGPLHLGRMQHAGASSSPGGAGAYSSHQQQRPASSQGDATSGARRALSFSSGGGVAVQRPVAPGGAPSLGLSVTPVGISLPLDRLTPAGSAPGSPLTRRWSEQRDGAAPSPGSPGGYANSAYRAIDPAGFRRASDSARGQSFSGAQSSGGSDLWSGSLTGLRGSGGNYALESSTELSGTTGGQEPGSPSAAAASERAAANVGLSPLSRRVSGAGAGASGSQQPTGLRRLPSDAGARVGSPLKAGAAQRQEGSIIVTAPAAAAAVSVPVPVGTAAMVAAAAAGRPGTAGLSTEPGSASRPAAGQAAAAYAGAAAPATPTAAPAAVMPTAAAAAKLAPEASGLPVRLAGYDVGRVVGEGGFCQVRLGTHHLSGRKVAIKVIDKTKLGDANEAKRIHREVRVHRRLNHPSVVKVFEVVDSDQQLLLIMEYAPNGSLLDYVRSRKRLSEAESAFFLQQLVAGLQYCHACEVVHRDIKLENILLDCANGMKVIDFGLAAFFQPGKQLHVHCGSPSYAAPEIVARKAYDGPPVDVWSLGIVLFAMVCGYLPFHAQGGNKQDLCQKIMAGTYTAPDWLSADARDLLARMLTVDPAQRIILPDVLSHPWVSAAPRWEPPLNPFAVRGEAGSADSAVLAELEGAGYPAATVLGALVNGETNHAAASYYLLVEAKAEAARRLQPLRTWPAPAAGSRGTRGHGSGGSRAGGDAAAVAGAKERRTSGTACDGGTAAAGAVPVRPQEA